MLRRLAVALLAVLFSAASVLAADGPLVLHYDVDSTTLTYCRMEGRSGGPFDGPVPVAARLKTVGAAVTLTAFTASSYPFRNVVAGDVLVLSVPTALDPLATTDRVVITKTSNDEVVVDSNATLTGAAGHDFGFYKLRCGTTADDGWVAVPQSASHLGLGVVFEQGDIATLVARWECRPVGSSSIFIVYPGETSDCGIGATLSVDRCAWAAAKAGAIDGSLMVDIPSIWGSCRVGLAYVTSDTLDTTTALEKVSVWASFH